MFETKKEENGRTLMTLMLSFFCFVLFCNIKWLHSRLNIASPLFSELKKYVLFELSVTGSVCQIYTQRAMVVVSERAVKLWVCVRRSVGSTCFTLYYKQTYTITFLLSPNKRRKKKHPWVLINFKSTLTRFCSFHGLWFRSVIAWRRLLYLTP